jgi:hypothetical protein
MEMAVNKADTIPSHGPAEREALMAELGLALYHAAHIMGSRPPTPRQLVALAQEWIHSQHDRISELIHSNPEIRDMAYGTRPRDMQRLVTLIADGLAAPFVGFPVSTAALVIAHYYLDHFIKQPGDAPAEPPARHGDKP